MKSHISNTTNNAHAKSFCHFNCSDESLTVFWREFIVGIFIDVVASDGDIDAIRERPVPLHVPFVSID